MGLEDLSIPGNPFVTGCNHFFQDLTVHRFLVSDHLGTEELVHKGVIVDLLTHVTEQQKGNFTVVLVDDANKRDLNEFF